MTLDELLKVFPPPWTAIECGCTGCECRMIKSAGNTVDFLNLGYDIDPLSGSAANLLAAAPDMLAILESLNFDNRWHLNPAGMQQIRDVIAKAKGETACPE